MAVHLFRIKMEKKLRTSLSSIHL